VAERLIGTVIMRFSNRASDGARRWSFAGGRERLVAPSSASQGAPRCGGEQMVSDLVEVRQRKHRLRSSQVLGQAPVSHLGESPQLLDHPKGLLPAVSGPRACRVDPLPSLLSGWAVARTFSADPSAFGFQGTDVPWSRRITAAIGRRLGRRDAAMQGTVALRLTRDKRGAPRESDRRPRPFSRISAARSS
jgi:hypothetical protein